MLNKVQMQEGLIINDIPVAGTSMIEEVIVGLSISSKLGGMMQCLNTLQFHPLG